MKPRSRRSGVSRRSVLTTAAALPMLSLPHIQTGWAQSIDPLPSWNKGVAKETIIGFVQGAVDGSSRAFVPPEARIATFDQDGTLWVEHPIYAQVAYCLERVPAVVAQKPELKDVAPFRTVLSGIAKRSPSCRCRTSRSPDCDLTGMTIDAFNAEVGAWLRGARHPRWGRPYTELTYQPMQEVLSYLRANGFKTYIVTGGGQDFVRPTPSRSMASRPNRSSARRQGSPTAITRRAGRSSPRSRNCSSMTIMPASPKASSS
jgi:hypothetical protein